MTLVEAMARAVHQSADEQLKPVFRVAWEDILPAYREMLLCDARAVLKAIREPTPAMLDAGLEAYWFSSSDTKSSIGKSWRAMIDVAIAEEQT